VKIKDLTLRKQGEGIKGGGFDAHLKNSF